MIPRYEFDFNKGSLLFKETKGCRGHDFTFVRMTLLEMEGTIIKTHSKPSRESVSRYDVKRGKDARQVDNQTIIKSRYIGIHRTIEIFSTTTCWEVGKHPSDWLLGLLY